MKIISIDREKQHLFKITLSSGGELLLDCDVVIDNSLFCGMEIQSEQIEPLKHESDFKRAKSRAFFYLDKTDYSEKALFDKLKKAGFCENICAEVLAYLCEIGIIDDRRYAERVSCRLLEMNRSKREVLNKLYLKGVPLSLAKEVLGENDIDEEAQITSLIQKKYAYKLKDKNNYNKVYAALVRRGFSYSAVKTALKQYIDDIEFSEEY